MTRLAKTENFWNRMSGNFDRKRRKEFGNTDPVFMESIKYFNKSDRILDYGCGTGESSIFFSEHVESVHGIDISSGMLAIANRKSLHKNVKNISFEQLTIFDKELKKSSYNSLTAFHILHLVENTPNVMKQIHHLLKEDGIFISSTVCLGEKNYFKSIVRFASKLMGLPYLKTFNINELKQNIINAGFTIVHSTVKQESAPILFVVAKKKSK